MKKTGKSAQTIAQAVENLELGGGTAFVVHMVKVDSDGWFGLRLDKTYSEIVNAVQSGSIVYLLQTPIDGILTTNEIHMFKSAKYRDTEDEGVPYRIYEVVFGDGMNFDYSNNPHSAPYPYEGEYPFADFS